MALRDTACEETLIAYLLSPTHASWEFHSCVRRIAGARFAVASLASPKKRFGCPRRPQLPLRS